MRILIADDDDAQVRWLEKNFLSADGFDVYCHFNALEALETYKSVGPEHFDVVITDYQMPRMTGVQLIEKIRQLRPDQHCVLQTSERGTLIPGVPQLLKPYGIQQLKRLLRLPVQPLLF